MKKIIDKCVSSVQKYAYSTKGIVLSIPTCIDKSLREMIMKAIEFVEKEYTKRTKEERKIILVDNSLSSSIIYSREIKNGMARTGTDETSIYCLVEMGFDYTEWTIVISEGQKSMILKKGYLKQGRRNPQILTGNRSYRYRTCRPSVSP